MQTKRNILTVCIAGAFLALAGTVPLRAADPTVAGFWEAYDDGKPGGWFLFFEKDGMFQGALVKAFNKPGETPQLTCAKCTDERKNAPMIGLSIVRAMQRKGLAYENGNILDPRDGSVYKAKMALSPDSKQLEVRGFLGIELFGQSQIWKRLPDTVMAPTELPEELRPYRGRDGAGRGAEAGDWREACDATRGRYGTQHSGRSAACCWRPAQCCARCRASTAATTAAATASTELGWKHQRAGLNGLRRVIEAKMRSDELAAVGQRRAGPAGVAPDADERADLLRLRHHRKHHRHQIWRAVVTQRNLRGRRQCAVMWIGHHPQRRERQSVRRRELAPQDLIPYRRWPRPCVRASSRL